jgi:hypothetical protein
MLIDLDALQRISDDTWFDAKTTATRQVASEWRQSTVTG